MTSSIARATSSFSTASCSAWRLWNLSCAAMNSSYENDLQAVQWCRQQQSLQGCQLLCVTTMRGLHQLGGVMQPDPHLSAGSSTSTMALMWSRLACTLLSTMSMTFRTTSSRRASPYAAAGLPQTKHAVIAAQRCTAVWLACRFVYPGRPAADLLPDTTAMLPV